MKKSWGWLTLLVVAVLAWSAPAGAAVLDFEDLDPGYETAAFLPAGYGGFNWSGTAAYITDQYYPGSGYDYGTVGRVGLFSSGAADMSMSSAAPFDFNGAYITAAWNTGETATVEGWLGSTLLYTQDIVTSYDGPYWWDFDYTGIDKLVFRSEPEDGQNAGLPASNGIGHGSYICIDNLTYNETRPVPEPATLLLVGGGLAGLAGLRRRKKS
jgi:hypothetical protein